MLIHRHHDHGHHDPRGPKGYVAAVRRILFWVLGLNWLVAVLKLIFGYLINSTSMVADGYHSFADGASNIVGLLGMKIAGQPKDEDHPYGHKKYETLASLVIAFLLFLICLHLIHDGWERLWARRAPEVTVWGFVVLGVTMVVNAGVMFYEGRRGRVLGSDILVADAMHTRADLLTSFSVGVAFVGVKLGFPVLDAVVAMVIAVFIAFSGIEILKRSSAVLCDTAAIDRQAIERLIMAIPEVKKCHKIRTRGRHDDIYIDLHVLVNDQMKLVHAHDLTVKIEDLIKKEFCGVSDIVVHVEPLSSETHHGD
ncbi:MAG: cation diffusion facilitator family transporter [Candidatus Omnitrophica bacterium]|nr:cation diffusion facilitator family transporter [Candidatus Omnitrophota bacterium]MDD5573626.1 cation diffusion facilitator family transporter [Candidatus Omnitrophota bacterium]